MIRTVAETGSTNADMLALAVAGASEGSWLRAERQTAGKGRQGRAWESPVGNFYGSTLVRLRPTDPPAPALALVTVVALEEAVRVFLPAGATIKWPNDLLIGGAKLSGVLLERAGEAVVVGIGVNLTHHPELPDRPATSLAAQGVAVDAATFAEVLAESFARWLSRWRGEGLEPVRQRWLDRAHPIGTALTARLPDGTGHDGLFDGLSGDGALILRLADGSRHVIHAGDVFLI
ncbi:BirA family biotin operon repressor/biotin-[acetyl-CoA-carboxylase] ligase [Sphingomonas sp. BE123]|uniref:biotin--[acetyl-CoA-carboxylase] ligase n=1 Tax=Sphingomonas sp. BE123 TaxID=2817842 RepID=UPI002863CAAB|nr:biotin--[acetyl-CoA-carboxylase] ligase [Sphingomonas sp. BE123]MDR6853571.1 BirA family biotin operon repressor/biotin-[acetyl-CoA-carboxylase] ligase [Sphingomonas sp. BE123]